MYTHIYIYIYQFIHSDPWRRCESAALTMVKPENRKDSRLWERFLTADSLHSRALPHLRLLHAPAKHRAPHWRCNKSLAQLTPLRRAEPCLLRPVNTS